MSEFREVVHAWAREQLERSSHTGPYEVVSVRLDVVDEYDSSSLQSERIEVGIEFRHKGCPLCIGDVGWWCMPDTRDAARILNELLALGDRQVER